MRELSLAWRGKEIYLTSVVKPFSQISVPHRFARAALFCLFALALPFAARALEVEGMIALGGGATYDMNGWNANQYGQEGFGNGSIVQIVAFTESDFTTLTTEPSGRTADAFLNAVGQGGNTAAYASPSTYEDSYFPGTEDSDSHAAAEPIEPVHSSVGNQRIIMTTALDSNLSVRFRFDYTELINQGYVGFYVRVFSTNEFRQGEIETNVAWGASALYTFQGWSQGGEQAIFGGITVVSTNSAIEVIPEPATTGLLLFGAAALLARRRRNPSRHPSRGGTAMKTKRFLLPVLFCLAALLSGRAQADFGSFVNPVYLMPEPDHPVSDLLGEPFPDGGLVEIREVGGGIVPPDPITGKGDDEANPVLTTGHVGDNSVDDDPYSGLFTLAIRQANARPALNVAYFARVYDAADPVDATLYADSDPFTLTHYSSTHVTTFLSFGQSASIDPASDPYVDSDGDGYTDREEAFYRGRDSDGDGWSDWFEINHGMDPNTPFSFDAIALEDIEEPDLAYAGVSSIDELSDEELSSIPWTVTGKGISWTAVSGVTYVIEFADTLLDRDAFAAILTNLAESTDGFADVSEYFTNTLSPIGFFRVKAVPQPGEGPEAE